LEEEALHVSQTCHRSNISGQLKETSGMKAYTARPTTGEAAFGSLPRSKAPGFDGLPYKFYQRFWEQLGPELTAVLQEAFQPDGPGQLPSDMTEGRITLLYKGKGLDRALPASYRPISQKKKKKKAIRV